MRWLWLLLAIGTIVLALTMFPDVSESVERWTEGEAESQDYQTFGIYALDCVAMFVFYQLFSKGMDKARNGSDD